MEKELIVIGHAGPSVTELLHRNMKSGKISGNGLIILDREVPMIEPDLTDLPILIKEIHKYHVEKTNLERVKPNPDWKKSGKPKKWRLK